MILGTALNLEVNTMGVPNENPLKCWPAHPSEILCEDFVPDWRFAHAYH